MAIQLIYPKRTLKFLSLCLFLQSGCSDVNDPGDLVAEIDICRDCGDGRAAIIVYENGVGPISGTSPIQDCDCIEWNFSDFFGSGNTTGSDTIWVYWRLQDEEHLRVRFAWVPLARKRMDLPCE